VEGEKSTEVELGLLEELHFADVDILEGVDSSSRLLNLTSDDFGNELGGQLGKAAAGSLALDNLGHLLTDGADLRSLGVGSLLDLVRSSLGESDGEETDEVVIGGLDGDVGLDESLPFSDQGAELVGSEVEAVEVGQAILVLDLVDTKLNLAESVVLILLKIGERDLQDTTLECIVGVLQTGRTVDQGLSDISDDEGGRSFDAVPVLPGERVLGLLLEALLSLGKPLVLSYGHAELYLPVVQKHGVGVGRTVDMAAEDVCSWLVDGLSDTFVW